MHGDTATGPPTWSRGSGRTRSLTQQFAASIYERSAIRAARQDLSPIPQHAIVDVVKSLEGRWVFAATDLSDHLGCEHLSTLNRLEAAKAIARPEIWDPLLDILAERGRAHELAYLESLRNAERVIAQPDMNASTLDLMRQGIDVILQAPLGRDMWQGRADFLVRVDRPGNRSHREPVGAGRAGGPAACD